MAYSDIAPTLSSTGLTKEELETEFNNMPSLPVPNPDPTITKAKAQAILADWCAGNKGIGEMAHQNDLTQSQVKLILKEIMDAHNAHENNDL
jgi:hypothetical protein